MWLYHTEFYYILIKSCHDKSLYIAWDALLERFQVSIFFWRGPQAPLHVEGKPLPHPPQHLWYITAHIHYTQAHYM